MMPINLELEAEVLSRQWFYQFTLPSGRVTDTYVTEDILKIHETRKRMLLGRLDEAFQRGMEDLTCVDFGCHEGFFSHILASRCKEVVGIDARAENVESATLLRDVFGYGNLRFRRGDVQSITAAEVGRFDVSLLFGILYHLENVVGALRLAQAVTRKLCLIETQVAPNLTGVTDWGSYRITKEIVGCLAIVDESDDLAMNTVTNTTAITLFPSLPGLLHLLRAVGFARTEVLQPVPDAYEQIASGKRVIVAAYNQADEASARE
jgi:hypothetical protein